ncbi:Trk system potassium uptake protein, TrkA [Candidatus Mycoplasma haematolamae str. Purdue]|uniref:Trk system potassium uptake protein, TrkA n=1 Tax=Mycoplasma haematolamae (strain Purdue) TaxID=1212765 RepID=I7CFQ8_MYCHA|nr:NAD-binding protein [Candidatus Mycoplasma haematolamae]AFO52051.1 Trk system potassium uptake protein, TrkA [Candidatus Mycoplasma haematolamae str. Purdue]
MSVWGFSETKDFCIIGYTPFTEQIRRVLMNEGHKAVLADKSQEVINTKGTLFNQAKVCDASITYDLRGLGPDIFECVFVGVDNFKDSMIICSFLRDLGVKKIVAKAKNEDHNKALEFLLGDSGFPILEDHLAERVAYRVLTGLDIVQTLPTEPDRSADNLFSVSFEVPKKFFEKEVSSLKEEIEKIKFQLVGIQRGEENELVFPLEEDETLEEGDKVVFLARKDELDKLQKFFTKLKKEEEEENQE